jgi:hypothetical protein
MGVRLFGVRLVVSERSAFDDLLFRAVGVAVTCGSLDAGWRSATAGFCGVLTDGSGRLGISGSTGRPACGDESAVIQLSSLDLAIVLARGVGACGRHVNKCKQPSMRRKHAPANIPSAGELSGAPC